MGFWDTLGDIGGGILNVGRTIAREASEFGGGIIGGATGRAGPVQVKRISDVPEWLGGQIGVGAAKLVTEGISGRATPGGGMTTGAGDLFSRPDLATQLRLEKQAGKDAARAQPTDAARGIGTSGVDPTWLEALMRPWGVPDPVEAPEMTKAIALPGGASIARTLGGLLTGAAGGGIVEGAMQLFGGGGDVALPTAPGAAAGTIFRVQGPRLVARRMFQLVNPTTGNVVTYKNVGRPVLYSGDFAACKRVARIARKAKSRGR